MQTHEHHLAVLGMSFAVVMLVGVGVIYSVLPTIGNVTPKAQTASVSNIPLPPPLPEPPLQAATGTEDMTASASVNTDVDSSSHLSR